MARRSQQTDPEQLRTRLVELLVDFEEKLSADNLRAQVQELIPAHYLLRDLGSSLVPIDITSARDRILFYLKKYPQTMISGEELMVVAGIGEWARRVRELRVQLGWRIITGVTVAEMAAVEDCEKDDRVLEQMAPDDYMLLDTEPDRDAAYRWNVANDLRKNTELGIRDKILAYLRENVGKQVTGDELRYVAGDKTEWARRVRELRTEYGWAVVTKQTGMPELPIGTYMLELDRQSPPHDRTIPDSIRREVLKRDGYQCAACEWNIDDYNRADPRILELHHKQHHADGGGNTEENLVTLCNICHDELHASKK
ncbi:MAG: HNH endonuclease [Candidatus Thiodiazotropha sp. (ex Ctena orbiculata)]|nr:HNH endonuclease [Candidatus Thiodiazotropha taylori]